MHIRKSGGENLSANSEDFARYPHGLGKVTGQPRESGQKKIPEAMTSQTAPVGEAVIKKLSEKGFVLGQRDQTIADITGRENPEFPPQATGASTLIGYRDYRGQTGNGRLQLNRVPRLNEIPLQPTQERG